jgi:succinyl-diaminopimelate desuccinylase
LADRVENELRSSAHLEVFRIGDNVIARTQLARPQRVILAGHLDTVPPNANEQARVESDVVWGLGSADMKGGLAVMLELAATMTDPTVDVTYVFYVAEEVARADNGLLQIEATQPDLLRGDAAVLGEPTSAYIEAGCQGVLRVEIQLGGVRAHTARPWMGVNALHRLGPVLDRLAAYEERRPVIDGCAYHEVVAAVKVEGGVAGNVVPDRVTVAINHRFAPDRDPAEAEKALRGWLEPLLDPTLGDRLQVVDCSPPAAPNLSHPLLQALLRATGMPPRAKLGWTDVAFFTARGIPAVNFGPGDPELAHTASERVTGEELGRAHACLVEVLTQAPEGLSTAGA